MTASRTTGKCTVYRYEDSRCGAPAIGGTDRCSDCAASEVHYCRDRIEMVEASYRDLPRYRERLAALNKALGRT